MKPITLGLLAILLLGAPSAAVSAVRIEGVEFDRSVQAGETRLEIRGYGLLRYMVVIKAYVGALYLPPQPQAGTRPDVSDPVAKRLVLEYFHAIDREDFAKATRTKIADNVTADELNRLADRIGRLAEMYVDVRPGDRYALTYIPGVGTELALNGRPLGTIPGHDFARAVFAIWLGENPIDRGFRDRLLGER